MAQHSATNGTPWPLSFASDVWNRKGLDLPCTVLLVGSHRETAAICNSSANLRLHLQTPHNWCLPIRTDSNSLSPLFHFFGGLPVWWCSETEMLTGCIRTQVALHPLGVARSQL